MARLPIDIIIPAFNQLGYCRQCVESIQRDRTIPHRLILIDNGSTDGVAEYFDSVPDAVVIHSERNLGFAGGVNLGLREAQSHAVLLNSDTIVPVGWLHRLRDALLREDSIGMVGPLSNYASGEQQIAVPPMATQEDLAAFAEKLARQNAGRYTDTYRLVGFCMLIRDRVLRDVGLLDERFETGNFEDDDYCLRVRKAGYRLCVAHDAFVFHFGSRTFVGMGLSNDSFGALLRGNEERFREKWGAAVREHSAEALRAETLNMHARAALEAGRIDEALRMQKDAVEAFPASPRHHNDLGVILWRLGDSVRAARCFERCLSLDPNYSDAQANLDALNKEQ